MTHYEYYKKQLSLIKEIKDSNTDLINFKLNELQKLPVISGVIDLKFNNFDFKMLNINNDDGVVLKYFWRNEYEPLSLSLWYEITRDNAYCLDIGAHSGIYSIVGNLNKKENDIISIEPYYLNFARMLMNLRLNNFSVQNCFLLAMSDLVGVGTLKINTSSHYLTQGAKLDSTGKFKINKQLIDNLNFDKKVKGLKIDTEGHEFEILKGGIKTIEKYLPDIIFEIHENGLEKCFKFLRKFNYKYYLINEKNKSFLEIKKFNSELLYRGEGANCFATTKDINSFETFNK